MSTRAAAAQSDEGRINASTVLAGILLGGLIVRLLFIGAEGYRNDVSSFMSWALTAAQNPLSQFYAKAGFADYPPGYLFVLWVIGHLYLAIPHAQGDYGVLRLLVKVPGCLADLANAGLIYLIVRRFASQTWANGAAALYAFNPATIYISAYWGQVDAVPAAFMLGAVALLLYAPSRPAPQARLFTICAWLSISYAILIKPPSVMVAALMLVWGLLGRRQIDTALGAVCGFALGYAVAFVFHPSLGGAIPWLWERYAFGSAVYPYNSVNAFNLHSLFRPFWQPDTTPVMLGQLSIGPMWLWGILLVAAASVLVVARYIQRKDDEGFLEAAMLLSLAFFVLSTRMHERYVFNAFTIAIPLAAINRRYLVPALLLSVTLLANLWYSLYYAHAMEARLPVDATDIFPVLTHAMSFLNVAVFFALGYLFLGGKFATQTPEREEKSKTATPAIGWQERAILWAGRVWFSPRQGLSAMTRTDWLILGGFTVLAFVLDYMWYWLPNERYFDEIYYPRSGIEYLRGVRINTDWEYPFEWTHPPLTKLLIAASIWMFGGVAHGDNGWGWRFLNVVCGTLMVPLCYLFAKRLLSSTLWASFAAFMLTFDGFRFVQSRIATPEIWVATLGLAVIYAFYRLLLAVQVRIRTRIRLTDAFGWKFWAVFAAGTVIAVAFSRFINSFGATPATQNSYVAAFLYAELGFYLLARWIARRFSQSGGTAVSYAEGSQVLISGDERRIARYDGGGAGRVALGELTMEYGRDGTLLYRAPDGEATFTPQGEMRTGDATVKPGDATTWIVATGILMALLAASKWNGLFDLFVLWVAAAIIFAQRFIPRPAVFGNPRGLTPDLFVGGMLFFMATLYFACYFPNYRLGYNLADIVGMQFQMFWYHDELSKTNPASLHHPYGSYWWQWPTLFAPISYYWHDFRTGTAATDGAACCVAEILALPNPMVWWFGLFSVPAMAWWGFAERNKGYLLLFGAYLFQWLPWILTPRIAFEYHFFPNLPIIVLANAVVLQRWWTKAENRVWIGVYAVLVLGCFVFFYPVLAAMPISYNQWHTRMWLDNWLDLLPGHPHPHGLSWIKPN